MTISGINSASTSYSAATGANDAAGATRPALTSTPGSSDGKSSVVTLSDGSSMNVIEGDPGALKGVSLAALRSPELLVAGDKDQDQQIDADEFSKQLARIGVSVDDAKKLFATFDASGNGKVSPEVYIQGVKDSLSGGSNMFKDLLDSYTNDANGKFDMNAYAAFMQKGKELAAQYAKQSGNER
jgi:hypothetical protein